MRGPTGKEKVLEALLMGVIGNNWVLMRTGSDGPELHEYMIGQIKTAINSSMDSGAFEDCKEKDIALVYEHLTGANYEEFCLECELDMTMALEENRLFRESQGVADGKKTQET